MRLTLLLFIIGATISFNSCQNHEVTADTFIQITYKQGPVAANRGPATFINIFRGKDTLMYEISKHYRFISKEDGTMKDKVDVIKSGTVTSAQLNSLLSLINSNNFMSLNPQYKDPRILDGDVESIKLELKNKTKEVVMVNVQKKRFNNIVDGIQYLTE